MDGVTAIRAIKLAAPTTRVIVLTSYHEDDQIFAAIKAGALSYLLKDTNPRSIVAAVRAAARGESVLAPYGRGACPPGDAADAALAAR